MKLSWFADSCFGEDDETCLFIGKESLTYADALDYCSNHDASLIQIEDETKYNFATEFARATNMIDVRWNQWNFWIDMHYEDVRINMHMYLINLYYDFRLAWLKLKLIIQCY